MTQAEAREKALKLARGYYQKAVLMGWESPTGSTLRGRAKSFSGRYAQSRENLFQRLKEAGIPYTIAEGYRGRRLLLLGDCAECYERVRQDWSGKALWELAEVLAGADSIPPELQLIDLLAQ